MSQYDNALGWNGTYVYAGSQRIGMLSVYGGDLPRNFWRAADPVTGDEVQMVDNGVVATQTTFDPGGVDVGFEDPFPPPEEEGTGECVVYDPKL